MQVITMRGNIVENVWTQALREPGHFVDMKPSIAPQREQTSDQFRVKRVSLMSECWSGGLLGLEINVLIWGHFPDPQPAHVTLLFSPFPQFLQMKDE